MRPTDQGLGVDGLPVLELRWLVAVGNVVDVGGLIDRREQSTALRLLVMTWVTLTPTSPSDGDPATKFGIAIGIGATLPSVTCNLVWALANDGSSRAAVAPAPPIRRPRRFSAGGGSEDDVTGIAGSFPKSLTVKHLLGIEIDVHVFPRIVSLCVQHRVGLALQHGAHRGIRRGLITRRASG